MILRNVSLRLSITYKANDRTMQEYRSFWSQTIDVRVTVS